MIWPDPQRYAELLLGYAPAGLHIYLPRYIHNAGAHRRDVPFGLADEALNRLVGPCPEPGATQPIPTPWPLL